jgi:predicted DNA-binding transcriptional regulator AlpA
MRRFIGIAEVCRLTHRSRSTINRYLRTPAMDFPRPVQLGPRDRGWYEDEVAAWIEYRPRKRVHAPSDEGAVRSGRGGEDVE